MDGYIKDYRQELQSDIWMMPPLYHRVWQYLKYKANSEDAEIPMRDGSRVKIRKGQHMTSIRGIAQGVGWYEGRKWKEPNPKTIKSILEWMKQQGMINVTAFKGNNGYTLITLINWEVYQSKSCNGNNEYPLEKQSTDINKNIDDDDEKWWSDLAETETERPDVAEVRDYYIQKIGRIPTLDDLNQMQQLLDKGFTAEKIKRGIDHALATYKPRYHGDKINSFLYCAKATQTLYAKQDKPSGGWKPRSYVEPARPNVITEDAVAYYRAIYEQRVKKKQVK